MSETIPPPLPETSNRVSKLTVSGLVLGILGAFCCGLFAGFPAMVCGFISLFRLKKYPSAKNVTLIIITLCLSFVSIFTTVFLAGLAVPAVHGVLEKSKQMKDVSDAKQIGLALFTYANDNDGKYPASREEILSAFKSENKPVVTETENGFLLKYAGSDTAWRYFPGLTTSAPPYTVLLQSADGHATFTVSGSAEHRKHPLRK